MDDRAARAAAWTTVRLDRRGILAGAAAVGFMGVRRARADDVPRLAAIDWAMLEIVLALGVAPVAGAELRLFREVAVEPALPAGVSDLGLRGALSYEQLHAVRPDLILISPWYENRSAALSRIAAVESFTIYAPGRAPYDAATATTQALGARIGRTPEAGRAIAIAEARLETARARLERFAGRRLLLINLADGRHFRVFGADSMFGDVAQRLGLELAWAAPTRFGAYPTVGVEALADIGDAIVVNVGPTPPSALSEIRASPLWRAMPPIASGRFVDLAPINPYGALPAAARFARLLADGLGQLPHA